MEDMIINTAVTESEGGAAHERKAPKKNNYSLLSLTFKILAAIVLIAGVVLGLVLAPDSIRHYDLSKKMFITSETFELWRALIFWFVGFCSALCLFAVSMVFGALSKRK